MITDKNKSDYKYYLLFTILSVVFLLFFSILTSPFYLCAGGDSGVFILMTRYFFAGMTPYVDFFDHKGPAIILIEAIGQCLHPDNRTGAFILQVISLTFVQILIFRCSRLFLSIVNSLTTVIFSLLIFALTIEGGNSTEEISLPYLLLTFYFTLKYCLSDNPQIKPSQILVAGLSFGLLFWIRPTNTGTICACMLFLFISVLKNKDYKGLCNLIIFFLVGFSIVSAIFIAYLLKVGAWNDMVYATFTFNLKYMDYIEFIYRKSFLLDFTKTWISLIVLATGILFYYRRQKNRQLILLGIIMLVVNLIMTNCIGPGFYHYMTLNLPCLVLGSILILDTISEYYPDKKNLFRIISILPAAILFVYITLFAYRNIDRADDTDYVSSLNDIMSDIPENDRKLTYAYNVDVKFWYYTDLLPYYKYFILQEAHSRYDEKIPNEINSVMENRPPRWMVMQPVEEGYIYINPHFFELLAEKYYLYRKNDKFELFKLKESNEQ